MQDRIPSASGRRTRGRFDLRSERGGLLVEVMVSAVLVVMVATAVFKSIDASSRVSGSNKAKGVATSLAQEKLDDLRAMDPDRLSNYRGLTDHKMVDNIDYSLASTAQWISDATGSKICTGAPGDYIKLTVTVTWPGMAANEKPIEAQTIVTQPNGTFSGDGNLAVKITDAASKGVEGINVNISGPAALTDTTDENGCAFFGHLKPGTYAGSFSQPGYVDMQGVNLQGGNWTVVADQTAVKPFTYDIGANPNVNFALGNTTTATTGQHVTFSHIQRTVPLQVGTTGSDTSSLSGSNLFPFTTPYAVYSGKAGCDGNSSVTTSATLPTPTTIVVKEPPLNINITSTPAPDMNTAYMRVRHPTSGCYDTGRFKTTTSATAPIPAPGASGVTNGFPAANYTVCVELKIGTATRSLTKSVDTRSLPGGNATSTFNVTNSSPSVAGGC